MADNVTRVLKRAKNLLDVEGWIQGEMHNALGYCSVGAIHKAANEVIMASPRETDPGDLTSDALFRLHFAIAALDPDYIESYDEITAWNDEGGRDRDEVMAAFQHAIEEQ